MNDKSICCWKLPIKLDILDMIVLWLLSFIMSMISNDQREIVQYINTETCNARKTKKKNNNIKKGNNDQINKCNDQNSRFFYSVFV